MAINFSFSLMYSSTYNLKTEVNDQLICFHTSAYVVIKLLDWITLQCDEIEFYLKVQFVLPQTSKVCQITALTSLAPDQEDKQENKYCNATIF